MARSSVLLALVLVVAAWFGTVRPAPAEPAEVASFAPAAPSDLYLDWLSGWTVASTGAGESFRIGLDPETGEGGHAPLDRAALQLSAIPAPPLVIHRADGSIEVILDPSIVDYVVARIGPDGRPVLDCAPRDDVHPLLSAPAASGAPDR